MQFPTDKPTLRRQLIVARQTMDSPLRKAAEKSIGSHIAQRIAPNDVVGGYCAINGEVDVFELLGRLFAGGQRLCLPVVVGPGQPLVFKAWKPSDGLKAGAYKVLCPVETAENLEPDVVLVPLVGYNALGFRLGYGGGYYDRTIEALRKRSKPVHILGIGFSQQSLADMPVEPHDQRLDAIITENGVQEFS